MIEAIAYIDGSGNSSRIQACAVTMLLTDHTLYEEAEILPAYSTNNVGEYSGLLLCLRVAKRLDVEVLHVRSDSKLIVMQTNGLWKCRNSELEILLRHAWRLAESFASIDLSWVPRRENKRADTLCRTAQAEAEKLEAVAIQGVSFPSAARPRPHFLPALPPGRLSPEKISLA